MKQALWKRCLSHLFELHIESAPSELNPHLYVSLKRGRYQLCTANAIYSYGDLYDNFADAFDAMDWQKLQVKNVLILGFGLGSIPILLEQKIGNAFHYTAVEMDESVLYLANKYALPELESSIELICTDAYAYVMQCQQKYDLITMDIFVDDVVPEQFESAAYLEQLKSLIAPNGVLLYNRLAHTDEDVEGTTAFYTNGFQPVYEKGGYLELNGNRMLCNRTDLW